MKKDTTYILFETIMAAVEASGLPVAEKKNWLKVMGQSGRRLYVPKTKRVGRIDLVGLGDREGRTALGGESEGSVTHRLDFSRPEADVVSALQDALEELLSLPAAEPRRRSMAAKAQGPATETPSQTLARLALIRETAKRMGVQVSASSPAYTADEEVGIEEQDELLEG